MMPHSVPAPTVPIPFHRLLKVVAYVDPNEPQTKELIQYLAAERFDRNVDAAAVGQAPDLGDRVDLAEINHVVGA